MKVAFYDSGLGGLSVLKQFVQLNSDYELIYYADSANAPYGDKRPTELIKLVTNIFDFFQAKEVDLVVSACNSSSALLDQMDLSDYDFEILGLNEVMNSYFSSTKHSSVSLLATQATVNAKRYQSWSTKVEAIACPKLVPLVEANKIDEAKQEFASYLDMINNKKAPVILGCTHYPFLKSSLTEFEFIDPAEIAFDYACKKYKLERSSQSNNQIEFFSSAEVQALRDFWQLQLLDHL